MRWKLIDAASRDGSAFRSEWGAISVPRPRVALILINDSVEDAALVLFGKETGHIKGRRGNFDASDFDFPSSVSGR